MPDVAPGDVTSQVNIEGYCDEQFAPVRDAFENNFRCLDELGAAVAVYQEGELVVDLWGGFTDLTCTQPWKRDTIVSMASVVKGMLAFALHMVAARGLLSYDEPVARYWPEFAQAGKQAITVRQLISHHAALPFTDSAQPCDTARWDSMIAAISRQPPEWAPGTRGVYHTVNIVFMIGELIARATGEKAWEFFRREITDALDVEFYFHLTDAELRRLSPDYDMEFFTAGASASPEVMARLYAPWGDPEIHLTPQERARLPYLSSAGNARGAARLFAYAAMDGAIAGRRILSPRIVDLMSEVQWNEVCPIWGKRMRTALGLFRNDPDFFYIGPNPNAFGTAGAGGSFAMADRDRRLSVAYSLNRWWPATSYGERACGLIDAVYSRWQRGD